MMASIHSPCKREIGTFSLIRGTLQTLGWVLFLHHQLFPHIQKGKGREIYTPSLLFFSLTHFFLAANFFLGASSLFNEVAPVSSSTAHLFMGGPQKREFQKNKTFFGASEIKKMACLYGHLIPRYKVAKTKEQT